MPEQNTPFIVKVSRCFPCFPDSAPLVVAASTKPGYWNAIWMEASLFLMKEDQQWGYFICTKKKDGSLRVHKEVRRKGEKF